MNKARILIVEDQLVVAEDLARLLEEAGYEILGPAETGEHAVEIALSRAPDLILVDIQLRGKIDGIQAVEQIKARLNPAIVYLSAHSSMSLFERAKGTQPDGYLYKPVSPLELKRTVDIVLFKQAMEGRLRESEQNYKVLVEASFDGILVLTGTKITFANSRLHAMLGYDQGELVGLDHWVIYHPDFRTTVRERAEARLRGERVTEHYEVKLLAKDRRVLDGEIRAKNVSFSGAAAVQVWIRDVTELKEAQERLSIEKQQFEVLVENAPFGLVIIDGDGTFRYANRNFVDMFGYSLAEVSAGREWFENAFPDPIKRNEAISAWVEDLRRSQPGKQRPRTYTVTCKDGTEKIVEFRPVQLPAGHHLMTCEDITERWLAQERLRQSEEEFRRIIENLQDPFYRADMKGIFTFLSPASKRVAGYTPEEGVGRPIAEFYIDPSERANFMKQIIENGFVNDFEARMAHKDGRVVWVSTSARLFKDKDGNPAGVEGIARDITQRKKAEEVLKERESLIRSVSDNLPAGMIYQVVRRPDGSREFTYLSEAVRDFYGCSPEEALNNPALIYSRVHEDDRMRVHSEEEAANAAFSDFRTETRMINPSGEVRWSQFASSPRLREDGSTCWSGLEIDITERKRVEEALRHSEEKFRLMFEFSPLGIFHFDQDGTITECNDNFVKIIGSSRERLIGLNTIQHVRDAGMVAAIQAALSGGMGHYEGSYASVTAPKTTPVKCDFAPIVSQDGAVSGGIGIIEDITERTSTEEALRKSEHLYRSVIENIEDVFFRADGDGRLLMSSPSGARIFGYERVEEMIGEPIETFWVNPEEERKLIALIEEQGNAKEFEALLKRKDGSRFVASFSAHSFRDEEGEVEGVEGIVRDVSESKRIEAQLLQSQKLEAIGTLAGGIAHDVNNLLQIVLGHADMLLLRDDPDEKSLRSIDAIRRAARNGAELVKRVLTFSRKTEPEMRPVNLSDEVRRMEELLRRTIPKMIDLEMSLEENLRMINADPAQIEQILLNLAVNAKDAMPEGGRMVFETGNATIRTDYCRTHPEVKPGKYVQLSVSDTGSGMEKGIMDRVFEPFFTTKQPGEGTGLGLSLVFGVVKSHGGHITCYSESGVGSTFKIFFPVPASSMTAEMATTMEMPAGGMETLLLVDDEEAIRSLGMEMLEYAGYTVLTAANGREALEVYCENRESISLVILDLVMPEMSGKKCLEELIRIDPNVRVLIASGYAANGPAKEARDGGAAGFVSKPFDLKQILLAVRKTLDGGRKGRW